MTPGTHGSTFGGNPLAMAVGNSVIDEITNKSFLKKVNLLSKYFHKKLYLLKNKYPNLIKSIRGKGFLIGIQLHKNQNNFIKQLREERLLTIKASDNVIRLLPPLNVKKIELDMAIKIIEKVCHKFY